MPPIPASSSSVDAQAISDADRDSRRASLMQRMGRMLGIDFHILQTLLLRGWSIIAGAVMVLFVPHWFSAVEQGYYYTFLSLIAVQIFFELGMSQIIVQFVSHEAAHLREGPAGAMVGSRKAITRLASLVQLITRWYRVAALLFFVGGGAVGALFFRLQSKPADWTVVAIWLMLVLLTAANLYLSASLAIQEGFGRVGEVARMRLAQSVLGYFILWGALSLGSGLWATPILAGAGTFYTVGWLRRHGQRLQWLRTVEVAADDETLSWRRDVFPLQWRIALSWISGYLILQLLVPMAFTHQGAVAAGRLGLTLTIFNSLLSVGLSWVNARLPIMAGHLAREERAEVRSVFRGVLMRSSVITAFGSLSVVIAISLMPEFMRVRFSDMTTLVCLSLVTVINCVTYAMATFIRAHKEEPLMVQSVVSALAMVPAVYFGSRDSIAMMMTLFTAIILFLALPWITTIFARYYRRETR